jgi:hypothetical protein
MNEANTQGQVTKEEVAQLLDQMQYRPGLLTVAQLRRAAVVLAHTEDSFQGLLLDNRQLADEIQNLQRALSFWLPMVPQDGRPAHISDRVEHDAFLLCGYDPAPLMPEQSAETLGWIELMCPHGMALSTNACGPCSSGRANYDRGAALVSALRELHHHFGCDAECKKRHPPGFTA